MSALTRPAAVRETPSDQIADGCLVRTNLLIRPVRTDIHLEIDLAGVLGTSEPRNATAIADAAAERAQEEGMEAAAALARVVAAHIRAWSDPAASLDELEELARAAIPLLEEADDHAGLAHVWHALGFSVANYRLHMEEHVHASEQALRHARLAGLPRDAVERLEHATRCSVPNAATLRQAKISRPLTTGAARASGGPRTAGGGHSRLDLGESLLQRLLAQPRLHRHGFHRLELVARDEVHRAQDPLDLLPASAVRHAVHVVGDPG